MTARTYESLERAAARTGVSVGHLRSLIASGELPAYRISRRILRVDRRDADSLLTRP